MKSFLRENWAWIVVPILLVAALVVTALFTATDLAAPFTYNVF
jgi:hypothetical protein